MTSSTIGKAPALTGRARILRDQDIVDMWILDMKNKAEIAYEVGMTVGSIGQLFTDYRRAGVKIPRRIPGKSREWMPREKVAPIQITEKMIDKLTETRKSARKI